MARFPARPTATALAVACALASSVTAEAAPPPYRSPAETPAKGSKPPAKATSKTTRASDLSARRAIAGGPTAEEASLGPESPELRTLRDASRELFPQAVPAPGHPWPAELLPVATRDNAPTVVATGLPPEVPLPPPGVEAGGLAWLAHLELPDLPVRWDERVVRYLQYFRDDPRGHATFATLYRHSGRWREMIRRALRRKSLPEDLAWVSMIESGFDVTARSTSGASGLWQFMPETAKVYGLSLDRWLDQRLNAAAATDAAADFLGDLHRRFGSWELALAGFNMGYVGLSSVVRRYNTNDFWSLARTEGTLPWETTLYVPKILAAAVVAHNLTAFGFGDLVVDPAVLADEVDVPPGTPLALVAQAAGCSSKDIESLNPELRAARTPPASTDAAPGPRPLDPTDSAYPVKVPEGKGASAAQALSRLRRDQPALERYVVRFGETLEQVAIAHRTTTQKLVDLNAIAPGEAVRGGTVLLVPHVDAPPGAATDSAPAVPGAAAPVPGPKPSVVVPADVFVYPDRKRVFYRVRIGDTLKEIASSLQVAPDDLRRWNDLDPSARLQEGMTLQAYVAEDADLSRVAVVPEVDVHVLPVGSDEFFAALEHDRGFRRVTLAAKAGDTIESIGRRFDVPARTMERINRRPRADVLKSGDSVVVYVPAAPGDRSPTRRSGPVAAANASDVTPNGPLPAPPVPDLLP
jgi:membrane-bound lytic murein transglycosylase D